MWMWTHVKFVFGLRHNARGHLRQNCPNIPRKTDRDRQTASEGKAIPIQLRQRQYLPAHVLSRRLAVVFDDLQRSWNSRSRITAERKYPFDGRKYGSMHEVRVNTQYEEYEKRDNTDKQWRDVGEYLYKTYWVNARSRFVSR